MSALSPGPTECPAARERMGQEDHYFLKPHPGPAMQRLEAWVVVVVAVHAIGWVKGLLAEDFCRVRTRAEKPYVKEMFP